MTYNRLEAKPIPGEHCHFCGDKSLPLVKMSCCNQWACCDTSFLSIRGGEHCQFEHDESYSICHFHYNENHQGLWQECKECRDFFEDEQFNEELKNKF